MPVDAEIHTAGTPGVRAWMLAIRVPTLSAAVVPVLVGTAIAMRNYRVSPAVFVVTLCAALLIQIGTNLTNDLFDFQKGADTGERLGPVRVVQSGLISPRQVAWASAITFAAAIGLGFYLVMVGGWPIVAIGLAAVASGIAYTGGPWPLGYHGLGDLFVFIFFGLVAVTGTYYVQAGAFSYTALAAAVPVGLLIAAILVVNNVRDIETDRLAGKRTLAVRLGRGATRLQYAACLAGAYLVPLLMWLGHQESWLFWLPWLSAPIAVRLVRTVSTREDGPALNGALK